MCTSEWPWVSTAASDGGLGERCIDSSARDASVGEGELPPSAAAVRVDLTVAAGTTEEEGLDTNGLEGSS